MNFNFRRIKKMRKITRNEINKTNMVAIGYCQAQAALNLFGADYKIGYNAGVYGWNYDLSGRSASIFLAVQGMMETTKVFLPAEFFLSQ